MFRLKSSQPEVQQDPTAMGDSAGPPLWLSVESAVQSCFWWLIRETHSIHVNSVTLSALSILLARQDTRRLCKGAHASLCKRRLCRQLSRHLNRQIPIECCITAGRSTCRLLLPASANYCEVSLFSDEGPALQDLRARQSARSQPYRGRLERTCGLKPSRQGMRA